MAVRLNERTVASLKATDGKRREVADAIAPGLYVVVQASGAKSWAFRYRHGGRSRKLTLGPCPPLTLADARDLARAAAIEVAKGVDPAEARKAARAAPEVPHRDRFEVVAAEFFARHVGPNLKPSTADSYASKMQKHVLPYWEGRDIKSISRRDVVELLDRMGDAGLGARRNRVKALLSKLFNWAVAREIVPTNPVQGVERPAQEAARDRFLTDEELATVWRASGRLGAPYDAIVRLLILTGQRRGEVAAIRWAEIDRTAATWTMSAARTKNGRPHTVPLSEAALATLDSVPRVVGREHVFGTRTDQPLTGFTVMKRRLDALVAHEQGGAAEPMAPWTFHDLRRTFATGCAALGIPIHVVEKCLNHTSGSFGGIVSVYQRHGYEKEMRAAMDAWARHVLHIAEGADAPDNVVPLAR